VGGGVKPWRPGAEKSRCPLPPSGSSVVTWNRRFRASPWCPAHRRADPKPRSRHHGRPSTGRSACRGHPPDARCRSRGSRRVLRGEVTAPATSRATPNHAHRQDERRASKPYAVVFIPAHSLLNPDSESLARPTPGVSDASSYLTKWG